MDTANRHAKFPVRWKSLKYDQAKEFVFAAIFLTALFFVPCDDKRFAGVSILFILLSANCLVKAFVTGKIWRRTLKIVLAVLITVTTVWIILKINRP